MEFLKNYWYPLALSSEVPTNKPYGTSLLGEPLVLFRDQNNQVICLYDACPHQGLPLSRGKVVNGNVECPYHGWQFGSGGDCQKIPSLGEDKNIPKGANCRFAYPTEERLGVIWVFAGDRANMTPLRLPEGTTESGWRHELIVKELDAPHKIMIAGALDFAHFPFLHTQTIAKKEQRNYLRPLDVNLDKYEHGMSMKVKNPDGEFNDFVYFFEPPCLVKVLIEPKPGWKLIANDYFVPLTENKTRIFVFECRDWLIWNPLVTFGLKKKASKILEEDFPVVMMQKEWHEKGYGDWNCTVKADLLSLRYRQWYDRQAKEFENQADNLSFPAFNHINDIVEMSTNK
jgi:phenylpropionate dioxygenase-like ring-hydroxylating dioxygenase large terminal subunit